MENVNLTAPWVASSQMVNANLVKLTTALSAQMSSSVSNACLDELALCGVQLITFMTTMAVVNVLKSALLEYLSRAMLTRQDTTTLTVNTAIQSSVMSVLMEKMDQYATNARSRMEFSTNLTELVVSGLVLTALLSKVEHALIVLKVVDHANQNTFVLNAEKE